MAIDSRDKRASALFLHNPSMVALPDADGAIGQGDRQHVAMSYRGIAAAAPGGAVLIVQERGFFRFMFSRFFGRIN